MSQLYPLAVNWQWKVLIEAGRAFTLLEPVTLPERAERLTDFANAE